MPTEEEGEVCRLCETNVAAEVFDIHNIYCLIGNNAALKIASIDEKIFNLLAILEGCIFVKTLKYLHDKPMQNLDATDAIIEVPTIYIYYLQSQDFLSLSDDDFRLIRTFTKTVNE
jgi:hypothetical protein